MRVKKAVFDILKVMLVVILALVAILSVFIGIQIHKAPDLDTVNLSPTGYLTIITDREGNKIDSLSKAESNRVYVPLDEISPYCANAFIAIEDARFYKHHGIDPKGILRAAWIGITEKDFSQGASTITQQLLKNNAFDGWMNEQTLYERVCRKIQEQYLAVRIEQKYSKEWILENYLNTINLGGGTRGVQVASQYYFGKDASELTLAQSALIAGITQNPSGYDPLVHPEESIMRQQMVLKAMLDQGFILTEEYTYAVDENVLLELRDDNESVTQLFSWFEDALLEQVVIDLMDTYHYTEDQAWDLLYSGGLTICSTQNTAIQNICEEEITGPSSGASNAEVSLVMINNEDGSVIALIGGKEKDSSLTYNRATESLRQPGSTIKIIGEYAAALDTEAITLGTTVDDAPYSYSNGSEIHNSYGEYRGMTTIRDSIASSGNIVALKTYQNVGESTVMDYIQRFGISTLNEQDCNESLAIGGTYNGVSNMELTAAYHTIANDGLYVEPYFYTKVLDHDGNVVLAHSDNTKQVIKPQTAALLTSAMTDVITKGTGQSAAFSGMPLAGKSGTTNDNIDTWFVGYSPYYTCGVWTGYDNNTAQNDSSYAKTVWKTTMQRAHIGKEQISFSDISNAEPLVSVSICNKCGKLSIDGLCDMADAGNACVQEYYVAGTEPTESCSCHVKMNICSVSDKPSGNYCPKKEIEEHVFLKSATEGTIDTMYLYDKGSAGMCDIHTHIWSQLFDEQNKESNPESGSNPSSPNIDDPSHGEQSQYENDNNTEKELYFDFDQFFNWF